MSEELVGRAMVGNSDREGGEKVRVSQRYPILRLMVDG